MHVKMNMAARRKGGSHKRRGTTEDQAAESCGLVYTYSRINNMLSSWAEYYIYYTYYLLMHLG